MFSFLSRKVAHGLSVDLKKGFVVHVWIDRIGWIDQVEMGAHHQIWTSIKREGLSHSFPGDGSGARKSGRSLH